MELSINRSLNFVIPVEIKQGVKYYVHSTPLAYETFESYFEVMGKAFTQLFAGGYGPLTGPKLAKLMVKKIAENMGIWENGPNFIGVKDGLFSEIHRLTNVVMPTEQGWSTVPFSDAIKRNVFTPQDVRDIENAITFFMLASAVHQTATLRPTLELFTGLWGAQLELLNCTELANSLTTSTKEEFIQSELELPIKKLSSIPR